MPVPGVITSPNYESQMIIRGFNGLQAYRNGQYRRQLYSTWGMDRIEVIKGSSSIFFGLVRPGGVVNYITRKPDFRAKGGDAQVSFGSWEFKKAEINYNLGGENLAARVGAGAIGSSDGRVRLCFADQVALLAPSWEVSDRPEGELHDAIRAHLRDRGASFWNQLRSAAPGSTDAELLAALWDLVWSGEVTNDSLAPLRALLSSKGRTASPS